MKKLGCPISEENAELFAKMFGSLNAAGSYIMAAWLPLMHRTLHDLKGVFTADELMLMIDRHNGVMLSPDYAGQSLALGARDSIELDRTDKKWNVDKDEFLAKIEALSVFTRACLEVWAVAFWEDGSTAAEDYIRWLAADPELN